MEKCVVEGIPAVLWGEPSAKIYIYVHGKHGYKEYAEAFAKVAEKKGYQTLSFDLPKHGERKEAPEPCDIWQGIKDLEKIAAFTFGKWTEVNLFACSIGAFFALHAYRDKPFKKCLFQSPIIDMPWLIKQMMLWFNVSEAKLEQEKELKYTTNAEDTTIPVEEENEEYKTEKAEEETSKEETKQPELKVDLLEEIAKANQKPINLKEEVEKAL